MRTRFTVWSVSLSLAINSIASDSFVASEPPLSAPKHNATWDVYIEPIAMSDSDELETLVSFDNYLAPPVLPA